MNGKKWFLGQFPESLFKPTSNLREEYYGRVIDGRNIMNDSTVIFCGLARNIESTAESLIARIETLGDMFQDYKVILYENDSTDKTRAMLCDWRDENSKVELILEDLNSIRHEQDMSLARTTDMAYYRNQYLKRIKELDSDYTIILDTDIPGGFSYMGICNSLSYHKPVMAGNGLLYRVRDGKPERLFYDTFAYRPLNREVCKDYSVFNLLSYRTGQPPVKVFSAFSGLCIYKTEVLKHDVWYQSHDCDHPTLHKQLRELGYEIHLNPSQIVVYNTQDYCYDYSIVQYTGLLS